jgi:hypothetical protein
MASLFITRQNVPSFKEWKAADGREVAAIARANGAVNGVWMPDALNNNPAVRGFLKVPAAKRAGFLSGGGAGKPGGPLVQFEEHVIDTEIGLGGENKLTGAALMAVRLTLACPFDDFKVNFIESIVGMYPGMCKAYLSKLPEQNGDERAFYAVFFDAKELVNVKLSHDLTKPTAFRQLIDDAVVKSVEVVAQETFTDVLGYESSTIGSELKAPPPKVTRFDWVPEVALSFDDSNKGGTNYKVEVWGRINGEHIAKLSAACEYLAKHQHTFAYNLNYVIESDLEHIVRQKCGAFSGKAKDHLRVHAGSPLVLLNDVYLGSIREFESWANKTYGYVDKTMDALYAKRARKNFAEYMEAEKDSKDFVFFDMAYIAENGTAMALKPRIVVELYKNSMPKAAFNMVTLCEDKFTGMYVCMYVCMFVCMYVYIRRVLHVCDAYGYACLCEWLHVCVFTCVSV